MCRSTAATLLTLFAFACGAGVVAAGRGGGAPVPEGLWGGRQIKLVVSGTGASVEFDCAVGRIEEPLVAGPEGRFQASGTWRPERGGPARPGDEPLPERPARYAGWTDGERMRLEVTILEPERPLGPFELRLGETPLLDKCV